MVDRIMFVSNFSADQKKGGWDGINHFLSKSLGEDGHVQYEFINPKEDCREVWLSRVEKFFRRPRRFPHFSESRLQQIARLLPPSNDPLFFFGSTPWVQCKPSSAYFVYTDICFDHYVRLYFPNENFCARDVGRIGLLEKEFLLGAKEIFWGSAWAKAEAEERYHVEFPNGTILRTGGNLSEDEIHCTGSRPRHKALLFVSLDFQAKGGFSTFDLFRTLTERPGFSDWQLWIVGEEPPKEIRTYPGVVYHGFLDKATLIGSQKLIELYRSASFLVHLSKMDTMGAVLVEAGYCGLPCFVFDQFGMPEMLEGCPISVLVEKDNVEDISNLTDKLSRELNRLIAEPSLHDRISEHFLNEMSWSALSRNVWDVIRKETHSVNCRSSRS